jgi:TetR/AcrR family transcriptional regulator, transcriptional repressor of bet genes
MAIDHETTNWSIVWLGFLAAAVADAELIGMHRRNNRAWRQRVERLVTAAAPDWPVDQVGAVALGLIAMTEGVAAIAAADPAAYPADQQERMLDAALVAYGLGGLSSA